MRIVITGGGTGGHIYPAIAVAGEICKKWEKAQILFIGTKTGIESTAVPKAGFSLKHISAAPVSFNPKKLIEFIGFNTLGLLKAAGILLKYKPKLVIGSGGFVSAPVILAAALLKIPSVLLEQNVLPGKTNRLLSRFAQKVFISFEGSTDYFAKEKTVLTGNPVRQEIIHKKQEEALADLSLNPDRFTLLITGASQGAKSINQAVVNSLDFWKEKNWQIIHLAGKNNYEETVKQGELKAKDFTGEYRCLAYSEDMASLYAAADLVIARAGASTLAEITARGLPSILIPYPHAADNHQEKNARWMEKNNAAIVIKDEDALSQLAEKTAEIAENPSLLKNMSKESYSLGKRDSLKSIIEELDKIISQKKP